MFRVKVLCSAFNWVGGQTADSMAASYQMSLDFVCLTTPLNRSYNKKLSLFQLLIVIKIIEKNGIFMYLFITFNWCFQFQQHIFACKHRQQHSSGFNWAKNNSKSINDKKKHK